MKTLKTRLRIHKRVREDRDAIRLNILKRSNHSHHGQERKLETGENGGHKTKKEVVSVVQR